MEARSLKTWILGAWCLMATGSLGQRLTAQTTKYDQFRSDFKAKASQALGPEVLRTWDTASVYLGSPMVAGTVSEALSQARLRVTGSFPYQPYGNDIEKPFSINIKCPDPCPSCNQGWAPARWGCEALTAPCRAASAVAIAPCYLAMEITRGNATGAVQLEQIKLGADLPETIVAPTVSSDLTTLELAGAMSFSGKVSAVGRLKMTGDGRLLTLCWATTMNLGEHTLAARPDLPLRATVTTAAGDGFLDMKIAAQPITLKLGFEVSPFFQLGLSALTATPACPFAFAALAISAPVIVGLGLYDTVHGIPYTVTLSPDTISVPVTDVSIQKPDGTPSKVRVGATPKAISFVARSGP